ncbi:MAG: Gfo/Idh/MocA family oxidoreductase [Bacteroidota bacterium]
MDPQDKSRRRALKALAGVPVLGLMGFEIFKKTKYDRTHDLRKKILNELDLGDIQSRVKQITDASGGDLLRLGMVGYGVRGSQLAKALGFMDPETFDNENGAETYATQIQHGNLNVALTGICDVFDLHAEKGLAVSQHDIHTRGEFAKKHPVKRYRHYHEMLADPAIDGIIIATPDHHHAQMTIDAIQAGKHVYCEKSLIRREDEINRVYEAVKNSDLVFQLGHQIPQNAVFQQAKEIIKRGLLGKISHVETTTNRNTSSGAWIRHLDGDGNPKPGDLNSIDWKQWLGSLPDVPFSIERYYGWARFFDYDTGLLGQLFSHEFDAVNQAINLGIPSSAAASGGQYFYKDFGEIPDVMNCVFEYHEKELTLTYSANLTSSRGRDRTIYGQEASMNLGGSLAITPDRNSKRFKKLLEDGVVTSSSPMFTITERGKSSTVDAVSSATASYYSSRGLTSTVIDGQMWDPTHLHLKEWIECIRHGGETSANIEKAYEESVAIAMADISYREQCRTEWDPVNRKILRI